MDQLSRKYVTLFDGDTIDATTYELGAIVEKIDAGTAAFLVDTGRIAIATDEDIARAGERVALARDEKAKAARAEVERLELDMEAFERDARATYDAKSTALDAARERLAEAEGLVKDKVDAGDGEGGEDDDGVNDKPISRWNRAELDAEISRLNEERAKVELTPIEVPATANKADVIELIEAERERAAAK